MTDFANMKVNRFMPKKDIMNLFYDMQDYLNQCLDELEDLQERFNKIKGYGEFKNYLNWLENRLNKANRIREDTSEKLGNARDEISILKFKIAKQDLLRNKIFELESRIDDKNNQLMKLQEDFSKMQYENSKLKGKVFHAANNMYFYKFTLRE